MEPIAKKATRAWENFKNLKNFHTGSRIQEKPKKYTDITLCDPSNNPKFQSKTGFLPCLSIENQ